jgi:hypothetical protein
MIRKYLNFQLAIVFFVALPSSGWGSETEPHQEQSRKSATSVASAQIVESFRLQPADLANERVTSHRARRVSCRLDDMPKGVKCEMIIIELP